VEIKRGGAPKSASVRCEDLCAAAILGGEKGDDLPKDAVREIADAVCRRFYWFLRSSGVRFWPHSRVQDLHPGAVLAGASSVYIPI